MLLEVYLFKLFEVKLWYKSHCAGLLRAEIALIEINFVHRYESNRIKRIDYFFSFDPKLMKSYHNKRVRLKVPRKIDSVFPSNLGLFLEIVLTLKAKKKFIEYKETAEGTKET